MANFLSNQETGYIFLKNTLTTGKVCSTFDKQSLEKFGQILNIDFKKINRKNLCKKIELAFREYEFKKVNNKRWFYNIEEWNDRTQKFKIILEEKNRKNRKYKKNNKLNIKN